MAANISRDFALKKLFLTGAVCGVEKERRLLKWSRGELTALVIDERRLLLVVATEDGEFSLVVCPEADTFLVAAYLAEVGCSRFVVVVVVSLLIIGLERENVDFNDVGLMAGFTFEFDLANDSCDRVLSVFIELRNESPSESIEISKSFTFLFFSVLFVFAGEARLSRDILAESDTLFGLQVGRLFGAGLELRVELSLDEI